MPPRAGKSYITSLFCAYWLAQFPELSVMRNCCTATLYQKLSYDTRAIMQSPKFKEIFPDIKLQPDKQNLDGWNLITSKQVGYFGAGVGGTIIGFGASIAITDDLYKSMQDAQSSTTDNFVKMWKESAHDSRKEKNCPEIFIGTRWTENDVIGEAMAKGHLAKSIIIKAITEEWKSFCEDVKSTKEYEIIKSRISPSVWEAEYQQNPLSPEGILIPKNTIKFRNMSEIDIKDVVFTLAVGDPADTGGDKYSMPFIWCVQLDGELSFWVKDWIHNTDGIEANNERILLKLKEHLIEQIFIESNGIGLASVYGLKNKLNEHQKLTGFPSKISKDVRILSNYEFVQKYFIFDSDYDAKQEYIQAISDVCGYVKDGENKHKKDGLDVLCLAASILKIKFRSVFYG